jgi:hypothetical protein
MATCIAAKDDGKPCKARAQRASGYCFFHDPTQEEARRAAQQRGGLQPKNPEVVNSPPELSCSSHSDVKDVIEYAINALARGEIDAKTAYAIGFLAECGMRAIKLADQDWE